jgi:hypothetical protein
MASAVVHRNVYPSGWVDGGRKRFKAIFPKSAQVACVVGRRHYARHFCELKPQGGGLKRARIRGQVERFMLRASGAVRKAGFPAMIFRMILL